MKNILTRILMYSFYGILLQISLCQLLLATTPGKAQEPSSTKEIHLNLEFDHDDLLTVFHKIEQLTEFNFVYNSKDIDQRITLNKNYSNTSLYDILIDISRNTELAFKRVNTNINVRKLQKGQPATVTEEEAAINVSGTVTSQADGEGLPGVNVLVKGTSTGTVTDVEGNYNITVPSEEDILVFSSIGYILQEVPVNGRTSIDIAMAEDVQSLEEVVVVGYGTQKKSDITGAVSSISSRGMEEDPVTDISSALRGRAAGVMVTSSGNKPGDEASIRIRGNRSFSANNAPLFVVDGIPVTGGIGDINIQDIESIDVLKDASATAIYGSRGANGVILVTTKRGSTGPTTISYNTYISWSRPYARVQMMNGPQFAEYKREAYRASDRYTEDFAIFSPVEMEMIESGEWTDYQDLLTKTGIEHNHALSVSGGTENTKYNVSFNYLNDKGIIPLQDFTRYNSRINFDQSFGRFHIGTSTFGTYSVRNGEDLNPFNNALQLNPLSRPYDQDGNLLLTTTDDVSSYNPLAEIVPEQNINQRKRFRLFSSIYGEVDLAEGLKYRMNFGPDLSQYRLGTYVGSITPARRMGSATAQFREGFEFNYTLENILTYRRVFAEKHMLDFTGLYSVQAHQSEISGIDVIGVPTNQMQYHNLGASETVEGVHSDFTKWNILSGMARINYIYDDRYLLTVTSRMDGSSRFGANHKWGFFPSAALAWTISNEEFMADNLLWDILKLRLSYGITGNTGISPYQTMGRLSRTSYDFGGATAFGFSPSSIRNNDLRWEKTTSFNAGLDFSILESRLSGTLEFYRQNTSDLLLQRQLPQTSGFTSIMENVGKTRNTGFEGTFTGVIIPKTANRSFDWLLDLNFAVNKEEIVELYGGTADDVGNRWFIGEPIHVHFDYENIGIWQLGEESMAESYDTSVGQIKIKDQNEDGQITADDRIILGSDRPKLSGGLTSRISYKGFDFSIFLYGAWGNMIYSGFHTTHNTLFGRYNNLNVDYWTPDNPTNAYPQPFTDQERPLYNTTMAYFDGSYLKVRNINLGYYLPSQFADKIYCKSLKLYVSVQNPLFISPYVQSGQGLDPEFATLSTPTTKSFLLGLNISF